MLQLQYPLGRKVFNIAVYNCSNELCRYFATLQAYYYLVLRFPVLHFQDTLLNERLQVQCSLVEQVFAGLTRCQTLNSVIGSGA